METQKEYARTQADGLDNIAPTAQQGAAAWQYAITDGFLSSDEQAAMLRQQIEQARPDLEAKLVAVGIDRAFLDKYPKVEQDLFSGQRSDLIIINLPQGIRLTGSLRIAVTETGPEVRITPYQPALNIPAQVKGFPVTEEQKKELMRDGSTSRPTMVPDNGSYVPVYLRVDPLTNTVDLWKVKPEMMPTKLMGIDLTKAQQMQLAAGHPVKLDGLKDSQGETYQGTVSISASKQSLQFSDVSRQDMSIEPVEKHEEQLAQNSHGAKTDATRHAEVISGQTGVSKAQTESIKRLIEGRDDKKEQKPSKGNRVS